MNPFLRGDAPLPVPVLNIGHRGCAAAPENTLIGFTFAFAAGAHAIECDLRTSSDGAIVVMHDETVDRTTDGAARFPGRGEVSGLFLAELKSLDAGAGKGSIPTLRETLEFVRGRGAYLNLESKATDPAAVIAEVRNTGMVERVILSSFDLEWVAAAKQHEPEIAVCALIENPAADFPRTVQERLNADLIGPARGAASPALVSAALRLGLGVHVWTVNEPEDMKPLIASGVTGIFTDEPGKLNRVLEFRK